MQRICTIFFSAIYKLIFTNTNTYYLIYTHHIFLSTDNAYVVHQKLYFSENVHASIHRSKHSSLMLNLTIYQ